MKKVRVAILISGRGSNMKALIDACDNPDFPAEIALVLSSNKNALGLNYAKEKSIPTFSIDLLDFKQSLKDLNLDNHQIRHKYDQKINEVIISHKIDLICLAGFMRLLSPWFVNSWQNRILNIHPSLLPDFKGANAVKDALDAKVKFSGCTTHFVTEKMDEGPIIMQSKVAIDHDDDYDKLSQKILMQEHQIYPLTLKQISNKILAQEL